MLEDTVSVISMLRASIEQNDLKTRRYNVQMVLICNKFCISTTLYHRVGG